MYDFSSFQFQIPIVFWNPYYVQTPQTMFPENIQAIVHNNAYETGFNTFEEEKKNTKLSIEEKINLIIPKLKSLHKSMSANKKTHWTQIQDQLLQKLVEKEKLQWKQIPKYFQQRTLSMCYSRYRRILMNTKQGWRKQDDEVIINMVNDIGEKWKQISLQLPKFTPKQIRERYLNYLRPNIDKSQFDFDQDLKICELVLQQGKHWRKFEQELPGRTQGAIKSRYYSKLKHLIQIQ